MKRQNFQFELDTKRRDFKPLRIFTRGKIEPCGTLFLMGFTISELLLVVVIIALIGSVGGGVYVGTYKKMLVEKEARNFLLTAKYARIMAIERQCQYQMQLDVNNNGFALTSSRWNERTGETEHEIVKDYYCRPVEFEGDVKFEDIQIIPIGSETITDSEEGQTIVFWPNGTAESAVIQIGDGNTHCTVVICASTGKATMYFGTKDESKIGTIDLDAER